MLSTRTLMCGLLCRMWRVASMPPHSWHLQIHHDHIWLQFRGERYGALTVADLAGQLEVWGRSQQRAQPRTELLVVVGDQDPNGLHGYACPG
jgi:hypothetical protein